MIDSKILIDNTIPAGPELSLEIRGAILALHRAGFRWVQISYRLPGVSDDAAERLVKRTKEQTSPEEGILGQYKYLKGVPRSGRPSAIAPSDSQKLRDAILEDEDYQDMTFMEVVQELGIIAARSTIEKVLHQEH